MGTRARANGVVTVVRARTPEAMAGVVTGKRVRMKEVTGIARIVTTTRARTPGAVAGVSAVKSERMKEATGAADGVVTGKRAKTAENSKCN